MTPGKDVELAIKTATHGVVRLWTGDRGTSGFEATYWSAYVQTRGKAAVKIHDLTSEKIKELK